MGVWANVIVLVLLVIIIPSTTGALGIGLVDVLSQFPLFDVVIGVVEHQPLRTIIADKGFINFLLEIFEFLAIAIIVEYLQELLYKMWIDADKDFVNKVFSLPIKFTIGILLRFCLVVILYYGKTQLGQFGMFFGIGFAIFVAVVILYRISHDGNILGVITKAIIPLLFASADMLGLIYVCEGIYRSSTGLYGTPLLIIGIVIMAIVRVVRLLKNLLGF